MIYFQRDIIKLVKHSYTDVDLNANFLQYPVEVHQHHYVEAPLYSAREIYLCNTYLEDILSVLGGWL